MAQLTNNRQSPVAVSLIDVVVVQIAAQAAQKRC
jgi:hypothetical protein